MKIYDYVWKTLCDPDTEFGKLAIRRLLNGKYSDYEILGSTDPSGFDDNGEENRADSIFVIEVDDVSKQVHFEFQSTKDKNMALRMLQYGIQHKEMLNSPFKIFDEEYRFPDSYIVDVQPGANHDSITTGVRSMSIRVGENLLLLNYPVLKALEVFPSISGIMSGSQFKICLAGLKREVCETMLPEIQSEVDMPENVMTALECLYIYKNKVEEDSNMKIEDFKKFADEHRDILDSYQKAYDDELLARGRAAERTESVKNLAITVANLCLKAQCPLTVEESMKLLGIGIQYQQDVCEVAKRMLEQREQKLHGMNLQKPKE